MGIDEKSLRDEANVVEVMAYRKMIDYRDANELEASHFWKRYLSVFHTLIQHQEYDAVISIMDSVWLKTI